MTENKSFKDTLKTYSRDFGDEIESVEISNLLSDNYEPLYNYVQSDKEDLMNINSNAFAAFVDTSNTFIRI